MKCPFCSEIVENEYEEATGCKKCVKDWISNKNVDHFVD